jgi:hypothetical protein
MASLIETCKQNAVDPYAYLRENLTTIANGHPASLQPHALDLPKAVKLKAQRGSRTAYISKDAASHYSL